MTSERWLPVLDWEDRYLVSDLGRVWSLERRARTAHGSRRVPAKMLEPTPGWLGYLRVRLCRDGLKQTRKVHQLVAEAFHGPRPAGLEVLHGPGGHLDNRAVNLSWGTRSQNMLDKLRDGTDHHRNRTACPLGHRLAPPNLVLGALKRGGRNCMACARARSTVSRAARRGVPLGLKVEAERHYRAIMGQGVAATTGA